MERFSSVMADADQGKLTWGSGYEGLAAVILMDQLSRQGSQSTLYVKFFLQKFMSDALSRCLE